MTNSNNCKSAHSGIVTSTLNNVVHALQPALYSYLGAATRVAMPVIGKISPVIPAIVAITNIASRCEETTKLLDNKHDVAHHHHEIMADYLVSISIAATTYALTAINEAYAPLVVGTFFVTDVMTYGDDSPIDNLKAGVVSALDYVLGDVF